MRRPAFGAAPARAARSAKVVSTETGFARAFVQPVRLLAAVVGAAGVVAAGVVFVVPVITVQLLAVVVGVAEIGFALGGEG